MAKGIKTGGRQKGTRNKITGTVKEIITQSISNELESLPLLLQHLEPKERIDAIIKLIPYLIPKASPINESDQPGLMETHEDFVNGIMAQINGQKQ